MIIKFRNREITKAIRLHFAPEMAQWTVPEILKERLKQGKLNLGYHFIVYPDGELYNGIDYDLYADYDLDEYKNSIYVLVLADKVTDSVRISLEDLSNRLQLPVIYS